MSTPTEEPVPEPAPQQEDLHVLCNEVIAKIDRLFKLLDGVEYGEEHDY